MKRVLLSLLVSLPLLASSSCSLNPQPLPPGETTDASSPTSNPGSSSGGGSNSGSGSGGQTGALGDSGARLDAGEVGDSGVVLSPPGDGGSDASGDAAADGAGPTGDGAVSD